MLTNRKIYRLLPQQIPYFWNAIKFCCQEADGLQEKGMSAYFNDLLQSLLSEKAQCWVVLDEKKTLISIAVTRIVVDKVWQRKELLGQAMYSVETGSFDEYRRYFTFLAQFAKQEGCEYIIFNSRNPRMLEIARQCGNVERHRTYEFKVF